MALYICIAKFEKAFEHASRRLTDVSPLFLIRDEWLPACHPYVSESLISSRSNESKGVNDFMGLLFIFFVSVFL